MEEVLELRVRAQIADIPCLWVADGRGGGGSPFAIRNTHKRLGPDREERCSVKDRRMPGVVGGWKRGRRSKEHTQVVGRTRQEDAGG
jgi:hypothetical protein